MDFSKWVGESFPYNIELFFIAFWHFIFLSSFHLRPIILSFVVDSNSSLYTHMWENCTFLDFAYPNLIFLSRSHFSRVAIQDFSSSYPQDAPTHSKGIKHGSKSAMGEGQQPLLRFHCCATWASEVILLVAMEIMFPSGEDAACRLIIIIAPNFACLPIFTSFGSTIAYSYRLDHVIFFGKWNMRRIYTSRSLKKALIILAVSLGILPLLWEHTWAS